MFLAIGYLATSLAIVLAILCLVCWVLTFLGLPGNWFMVLAAGIYLFIAPAEPVTATSWQAVVVLAMLAGLGEIVEFAAGAIGTRRAGGSRRAAVLALLGSLIGGVVGITVGLPIPLVGSLVAALLFACVGALVGAVAGEVTLGRGVSRSWSVGVSAFLGRLLGTLGKAIAGCFMLLTLAISLLLQGF